MTGHLKPINCLLNGDIVLLQCLAAGLLHEQLSRHLGLGELLLLAAELTVRVRNNLRGQPIIR